MIKKILISATILTPILALSQEGVSISNSGIAPDPSAILDVVSSNKGLLIPRVNLSSTTSTSPVTNPTKSLLVYNSASSGTGSTAVVEGFYYWDGSKWTPFVVGSNGGGSGTDDQNIMGSALNGNTLTIGIENGNSQNIDLSSLANEYNTGISLTGTTLNITDGGGTNSVDLSSLSGGSGTGTDDQNISGSGLSGTTLTIGIENGNSQNVDLSGLANDNDPTNEYNTGISLSGTTLNITDGGGTSSVDLSSLSGGGGTGTDDQNISGSGLSGTTLTIGIENGNNQTVNLSSLVNDADNDPTNEFNTSMNLSGTTLRIIDGGGTKSVNLSSLQDGTGSDNQTLSISGTTLSISGGNSVSLPSSGGGSTDDDWYKAGTSSAPTSISQNIYTNGKVGIGVNNPSEKLEISSGNIELSSSYGIGYRFGTSSEFAIYPRKSGITSMTGYGSIAPISYGMSLESDQFIGIVESDNNALLGYYNLDLSSGGKYLKYVWGGTTGLGTNNPKFRLHVKGRVGNDIHSGILMEDNTDAVLYGKTGSSSREFALIGAFRNWDNKAIYLGGYNINNTWANSNGYSDANKVIVGGGSSGASLPIYATSFVVSSSRNVKENIAQINYGLNEVLSLKPVTYNYKFDLKKRSEIGFIAEEVNESLPQLVYKNEETDEALGMDYSKMTAVLVKAMQEQHEYILNLEKRINELEKK